MDFQQKGQDLQKLREFLKTSIDEIDDVRLLAPIAASLGLPLREFLKERIDDIDDVGRLEQLLADVLGLLPDEVRRLLGSPTMTPRDMLLAWRVFQSASSPPKDGRLPQHSYPGARPSLEKPLSHRTTWEQRTNSPGGPGGGAPTSESPGQLLAKAGGALREQCHKASDSPEERDFSVLLSAGLTEELAMAWLIESVHRSWPNRKVLVWLRSSALRKRIWDRLVKAGLLHRRRRPGEPDDPERRVTFETDRERRDRGDLDVSEYVVITHPPGRPRPAQGERGRPLVQIGIDVGLWGKRPRSGTKSALKAAYHQRFDDAVLDGWHPGFSYNGQPDRFPCAVNPQGFPAGGGVDAVVEKSLRRLEDLLDCRRDRMDSNSPDGGAWLVFCNNQRHVERAVRCAEELRIRRPELLPRRRVIRDRDLGAQAWGPKDRLVIISGRDAPLELQSLEGGVAEVFFLSPAAPAKMMDQIAAAIRTTRLGSQLRLWDLISEQVAVPPKPRGPSRSTHTEVVPGRSRVAALLELDGHGRPRSARNLEVKGERAFDLFGRSKERGSDPPVESKRVNVRWQLR
ncbi:MAG: hypothetical protein GY898_03105 [Proteobacteria bacterium]|nr:hypothetical protein [Pseudomonadota bacterium]